MDALASSNPAGFSHLCSHISVYNQPMSKGVERFIRHTLSEDIKLRNTETNYTLWDIPGMGGQLGKVLPFDIYGQHVLIDEAEMKSEGKRLSHGVFRYLISAAGVRRKEGGRRVYDYATMNFALACGAILGGAFLFHSRRRFSYLQRRPALSLLLSFGVVAATVPVVRSLFKIFAVGITIAERQHAKALRATPCYDCLCDIYEFTDDQIKDLKTAKLPEPKPGMPPITDEQKKAFKAAMDMQSLILGRDMTTIRAILKDMLQKNRLLNWKPSETVSKKEAEEETRIKTSQEEAAFLINNRRVPEKLLCEVHLGLRKNPETYQHPEEYPIFPLDRKIAQRRPPILESIEEKEKGSSQ